MVVALVVAATVTAAPPEFSVVVARRLGASPQVANDLAAALASALEEKGAAKLGRLVSPEELKPRLAAAGLPDPSVCNGAAACVATLARVSGLALLVALQVVKVGGDLALDLSVVDPATGKSVAALTRTVKAKLVNEAVPSLAADLLAAVPEPPPPTPPPAVVADAPVVEKAPALAPSTEPAAVVTAPAPGLSTSRGVALGLGAGAVVALVVGVALGASALGQASAVQRTDADWQQKVDAARGTALGADLSYVGAALLAAGGVTLFAVNPGASAPAPVAVSAEESP